MLKNDAQFIWPIVGNEKAGDFLTRSLSSGNLAHCYIFAGLEDLGKTKAAKHFAKNLMLLDSNSYDELVNMDPDRLSVSGDFHLLEVEEGKKNISIAQVRDFIHVLEMSSLANSYKIGLIKNAHNLSLEAQNALLKLMEEPSKKTVIILTIVDINTLLPTLVSRSQVLHFNPVPTALIHDDLIKNYGASPSVAKNISRLALGRPALAIKFLQDTDFYNSYVAAAELLLGLRGKVIADRLLLLKGFFPPKESSVAKVNLVLNIWESLLRDLMLVGNDVSDLIRNEVLKNNLESGLDDQTFLKAINKLRMAKKFLAANVNPTRVMENLAIQLF